MEILWNICAWTGLVWWFCALGLLGGLTCALLVNRYDEYLERRITR